MRFISVLGLLLSLCLAACGRSDERHLFLRTGTADLPILVRGPADSSTLVVFVHGGPGGSGLVYAAAMAEAFDPISARTLLAFYDQRGAGAAQGATVPGELTLKQHVQDLDDVLALLRAQYPQVTKIHLLGHSWGGTLTAAYLTDPARAAQVAGWINVDGATNFPRILELSRTWAVEKAQAKAASDAEPQRWRDMLAWYEQHPALGKDTLLAHYANVDALGGTTFDPSQTIGSRTDPLFFSPYSAGAEAHNVGLTQQAMADELLALDLHPALAHVHVPALFLHGAQDGRVPIAVGEEALAALGTPDEQKPIVRFERSGHRPFDEEPAKFAEAVLSFVDPR